MTSSTRAGSRSLRSCSAFSASEARSTACQLRSLPLRLPPAVRTASTITAVVMMDLLPFRRLAPAGRQPAHPTVGATGSVCRPPGGRRHHLAGPLELRLPDRSWPDAAARTWTAGWATAGCPSSARSGGPSPPTASTARIWAGSTGPSPRGAGLQSPRGRCRPASTPCSSTRCMNFAINAALPGRDRTKATLGAQDRDHAPGRAGSTYALRGDVVRMARQVAYGEASVRDPEGGLVSRATGTFLLHRHESAPPDLTTTRLGRGRLLGDPVLPPGPGTCLVCCGPAAPGFGHCFACRTVARLLHRCSPPSCPFACAAVPGRLYTVLMGYKESPVDAARRHFARLVGEHFATLFGDHAACVRALLGGGIDVVLPVPSSSRPGRSSLEGVRDLGDLVVSAFGPGAHWMPGLLRRSGAPVGHMRPHARAFAPTDQAAVRHARVLLLDDTYVSGARAQSASAALGEPGRAPSSSSPWVGSCGPIGWRPMPPIWPPSGSGCGAGGGAAGAVAEPGRASQARRPDGRRSRPRRFLPGRLRPSCPADVVGRDRAQAARPGSPRRPGRSRPGCSSRTVRGPPPARRMGRPPRISTSSAGWRASCVGSAAICRASPRPWTARLPGAERSALGADGALARPGRRPGR